MVIVRGYWKGPPYAVVAALGAVILVGAVLALLWVLFQVGGWLR